MPVKGNLNSVLQRLELEVEFVVWLTRLVGESPVVGGSAPPPEAAEAAAAMFGPNICMYSNWFR